MSDGVIQRDGVSETELIREKLVVLARELDRLDAPLIARAFHFEASYRSLPVDPRTGAEPAVVSTQRHIVSWLTESLGLFAATSHLIHQSQIEVRAERAFAETHVTAHHLSSPDDRGRAVDTVVGARWIDQFVHTDGDWLIL